MNATPRKPGAMEAEFDTVAAWTEQVVREFGPEYAIPAACRGSGSVAWLRWLAECLRPGPSDRFLDAGAGLGGPSAWLREQYGVHPVLVEPMQDACRGARRLFGLRAVAAWSQHIPVASRSFDAGWLLGVLCTTQDHAELLIELHRVLRPGGALGLLVLVQVAESIPTRPEGNWFPTPASLERDLDASGFDVADRVAASELRPADQAWQRRVARVEDTLEQRFGDRPAWQRAREQGDRISLLLEQGLVQTWLLGVRRRSDG